MIDIIGTYAIFASGIVANKFLLHTLPPIFFVGIRMLAAGLILLLYSWHKKPLRLTWASLYADRWSLLVITLCTTFVPSNLKSIALQYLPASKATLLGSIDPFVTAIFAYMLWSERLTWQKLLGICIGFFGVLIHIIASSPDEIGIKSIGFLSYAEGAQLLAVIISRYGWILAQQLMKKDRFTPVGINVLVMVSSGICSLLVSIFSGEIYRLGAITFTPIVWGVLVYTILAGNVLGYTFYAICLKRHNATLMSLAGFLVPLFVACLSIILLGEQLTLNFIFAAAAIFVGMIIFYLDDVRKQGLH